MIKKSSAYVVVVFGHEQENWLGVGRYLYVLTMKI